MPHQLNLIFKSYYALNAAIKALVDEDEDAAARVISMKEDLTYLLEQADLHQTARLVCEDSGKFEAYCVEVDIIEKLKRIYYHSGRIAKSVIETTDIEGEMQQAA